MGHTRCAILASTLVFRTHRAANFAYITRCRRTPTGGRADGAINKLKSRFAATTTTSPNFLAAEARPKVASARLAKPRSRPAASVVEETSSSSAAAPLRGNSKFRYSHFHSPVCLSSSKISSGIILRQHCYSTGWFRRPT